MVMRCKIHYYCTVIYEDHTSTITLHKNRSDRNVIFKASLNIKPDKFSIDALAVCVYAHLISLKKFFF